MIVKSAVKHEGQVFTGRRHSDCIKTACDATGLPIGPQSIQGFVTDKGIFMNRRQAYEHALVCGQLKSKGTALSYIMYSEDLW